MNYIEIHCTNLQKKVIFFFEKRFDRKKKNLGDEKPIDGWNLINFSIIDFDSIIGKKNTFGIFLKGVEQIILMSRCPRS